MPSSPPRSRYTFEEITGRYRGVNGRFVSQAQIRRELDHAILEASKEARTLAEWLRTRQITPDRWMLEMRRVVKDTHLWSAANAKGGWAQMSAADYGRVGQIVRGEYAFLERFRNDIGTGLPLDGRFLQRAGLYVEAGRRTYHAVETAEMEQRGMEEERSIRHSGDSCDGCIREAARGWVTIGTGVPIGMRDCMRKCKCTKQYR